MNSTDGRSAISIRRRLHLGGGLGVTVFGLDSEINEQIEQAARRQLASAAKTSFQRSLDQQR